MGFKEQLKDDLNIFFNIDEFGEEHIIDKEKITAIVDNEGLKNRIQKDYDGIIQADLLYFVKVEDIKEPTPGEVQFFDGCIYTIFDVKCDSGIYEVILQAGRN
ncbi:hypothetical protein DVW12_09965 [Clostridium botulinum]|nr:hypothetical protein [Clostridium botulinum]